MLHAHQIDLLERVQNAYRSGHRAVVLQAPTGLGKTFCSIEMIRRSLARHPEWRVAFLADREFLIADTSSRLGIEHGIVQSGKAESTDRNVQVCSIQTLRERPETWAALRPNFVIADEVHNACSTTMRTLISAHPKTLWLGLSATPIRSDGQPLCTAGFTALVQGPSPAWLCAKGFLAPVTLYGPATSCPGLAMDPVAAYREWLVDRKTLAFCETRAHAAQLAEDLTTAGYPARAIDGRDGRKTRAQAKADLQTGAIKVLTSCELFVQGFDAPFIDGLLFARKFGIGPWLQAIGRGRRVSPGKRDCRVIDLACSWMHSGLPDDERQWSIDGEAVRAKEVLPAISRCKACGALFRPSTICPRCGARAESVERIQRILTRSEKLELVSKIPQCRRDELYYRALRTKADKVLPNAPEYVRDSWAARLFTKARGYAPGERKSA